MCQAKFSNFTEQRAHAKSDFHRYNLKLRLRGVATIDETAFEVLVGDLDESLSGSDSQGSSSDGSGRDDRYAKPHLTTLLRQQAQISDDWTNEPHLPQHGSRIDKGSPLFWLGSDRLAKNMSLGVYKALFTAAERIQDPAEVVRSKQIPGAQRKHCGSQPAINVHSTSTSYPHHFLCMTGGGHFAAMIVSLIPETRKGPGGHIERHPVIKAHKTFHRYTTRRKQGGAQSANDNAKGNAHSAGASIRRHNEIALEADIREVLSAWKEMINQAELLFIRATGITSRRTLYGPYEGQVLAARDPRIRGFPFTTRRATQAELRRSFYELTHLQVNILKEDTNQSSQAEEHTRVSKSLGSTTNDAAPKTSNEDEAALMHTAQIQALIRRNKAQALVNYLADNNLSPSFSFFPRDLASNHHAPTPLHLAAASNAATLISALLTQSKADPTVSTSDGKVPFDMAGDGRSRDAFRVARQTLGESACDWTAAHVPSALSEEEAKARQARQSLQGNVAEAQRREAELQKLREQDELNESRKIEKKNGVGRSLGGKDKTAAEHREEEVRGLNPETKMKIERERRARAAEERIKRMQGRK